MICWLLLIFSEEIGSDIECVSTPVLDGKFSISEPGWTENTSVNRINRPDKKKLKNGLKLEVGIIPQNVM